VIAMIAVRLRPSPTESALEAVQRSHRDDDQRNVQQELICPVLDAASAAAVTEDQRGISPKAP
jgi:hypothetical protein